MAPNDAQLGLRLDNAIAGTEYDELGFMDGSEEDPDDSGSEDISEVGYLEERQVPEK